MSTTTKDNQKYKIAIVVYKIDHENKKIFGRRESSKGVVYFIIDVNSYDDLHRMESLKMVGRDQMVLIVSNFCRRTCPVTYYNNYYGNFIELWESVK